MTTAQLAYWNWQQAERRVRKCKEAHDTAGQSIAESQRDRWFSEWLAAEMLAEEPSAPTSPIAPPAPLN